MRDTQERIILDMPFKSFAAAKPEYDSLSEAIPEGHVLTLQHGVRIIFRSPDRKRPESELDDGERRLSGEVKNNK